MGTVANIFKGAGKELVRASTRLGPWDIAFTGLDYAQGKAQGEDDIRAAVGAGGSTAGGWGGALGGAATGAAIGSVVPIVGTVVGGGIGAIAGGIGGSFLGGWGADRADQLVRGNVGANDQEKQNEGRNPIAGAAALGTGIYGLSKLGDKSMMGGYNPVKAAGYNAAQTARQGFDTAVDAAGNVLRKVPLKQLGVGGLAAGTAYLANEALGNPIGQAIDSVTGQATNFAPNTDQRSIGGRDPSIPDPYDQLVRATGFENARQKMDYENQMGQQNAQLAYDRKFDYDDYMGRLKINADQASQLMNSYNAGMQNATQAAQAVLNTRWI